MSQGITIDIEGFEAVNAMFNALPLRIQRRCLKPALIAGAEVIAELARAHAPVASGRLRDTIRVQASKRPRRNEVKVLILTGTRTELGIPDSTKSGRARGYYPTAIEFGHWVGEQKQGPIEDLALAPGVQGPRETKAHARKALGRKYVPPQPFMRPALDLGREEATQIIGARLGQEIDAMLARLDTRLDADAANVVGTIQPNAAAEQVEEAA